MELFSEIKNRYFQLMFRIINECAGGKTKNEIMKIIDEGEFEQKVIGKNQESFADLVLNKCEADENFNLLTERNGVYYPSVGNSYCPEGSTRDTAKKEDLLPLPVRFSMIEKAWLKSLLDKEGIRMVLSKETIDKLQEELQEIDTPIRDEYFELTNTIKLPAIPNRETYEENFRILLNAIIQEKAIRYNNIDKKGNKYSDRLALPVSIEYSMRDDRFRVSMYLLDENRPIMANIFTLSDIRIVEEEISIDRETAKRLLFEQKYSEEPIVLEVTDKKAAMERCFMCFSGMERTARSLGNNKYEIRLNYYLFEEENLIRNIISLGPYVKVISPQRIADEVISRVKKAISLYNV
ncbi:MAG TPA: WYL domain-containing protein [Acetivibrio sp.]|nr:WYL domain-containing protein [Acetivibrio sp.]